MYKQTKEEEFLIETRERLKSVEISSDEVDGIAIMMLNLKNKKNYQKKESFCDKQLLRLCKVLTDDSFEEVFSIMEKYCKLRLSRKQRNDFVDMIYDCVVGEDETQSTTYPPLR